MAPSRPTSNDCGTTGGTLGPRAPWQPVTAAAATKEGIAISAA